MHLEKTVSLEFAKELSDLCKGLSAVVLIENEIWVANDETCTLERLSPSQQQTADEVSFGNHLQFSLGDFITLPFQTDGNKTQEIDIEGLDFKDGYLWLVGSHSLKRHKPNPDKNPVTKNFELLETITNECNRYILARIPVIKKDGNYHLEKEVVENGAVKKVAQMTCTSAGGNELTEALKNDKHLARFLDVPSKDNGFDIEGLTVGEDNRIFLGLRGPVLRGYAVILELQLEINQDNPSELKMKNLNPPGSANPNYRKHFLYLNGLGIRDLYIDGSDLIILAGPTMDLDGPVVMYRWKNGVNSNEENIISNNKLEKLGEVPFGSGADHAEGITAFARKEDILQSVLVIYDAVSEKYHVKDSNIIKADIFLL